MATAEDPNDLFRIRVRYLGRELQEIMINKKGTVKDAKERIVKELDIAAGEVDLLFTGNHMSDESKIEDLELSDSTVINAIKAQGVVTNCPLIDIRAKEKFAETINESLLLKTIEFGAKPEAEDATDARQCFYVYCRLTCKKVQPAKLRVRCSTCKLGTLALCRDPENWDDVLIPGKIEGECHHPNCQGNVAEFFFKCSGHVTDENESLPPLRMVVTNTKGIPCIICFDSSQHELFVFDCSYRHTICLECLTKYCQTNIQNRSFTETKEYGYTLPCPAQRSPCKTSYITSPHAFKIVGEELYKKYQFYATQEYVLQTGGVLCPGVNCGNGIIPRPEQKKVVCRECKLEFCRKCKKGFHDGDCREQQQQQLASAAASEVFVSPENEERARLDHEAYKVIDNIAKECPKCKVKIDKASGCNHMTCQCKFEFCWLCLTVWSKDCEKKHWFGAN